MSVDILRIEGPVRTARVIRRRPGVRMRRLAWAPISATARPRTVANGRAFLSPAARTSEVLTVLAEQEGERLTVGDIVAVLKDRAFALLIVILG